MKQPSISCLLLASFLGAVALTPAYAQTQKAHTHSPKKRLAMTHTENQKKISTSDFTQVQKIFLDASPDTVIFLDVDDALISVRAQFFALQPGQVKSPGSAFVDAFKKNRDKDPHFAQKIATWRQKRRVDLVNTGWPELLRQCQAQGKRVYALTQMDSGPCGDIARLETWRYNELAGLGVTFTPNGLPFPVVSKTAASHSVDPQDHEILNKPGTKNDDVGLVTPSVFYKGIYMTGAFSKADVLRHLLETMAPDQRPRSILFVDDREHHVDDLLRVCQDYGIAYTGILFHGVYHMPRAHLTPDQAEAIAERQKELFHRMEWKEDEEILQELNTEKRAAK